MPDVTLIVDGTTVTVPAGTNVVDAARLAGVAVPVFCYHPKMKPVGMCRMCLVEVYTPMIDRATNQPVLDEQGKPKLALMMNKLQTGCTTPVSEGMVVRTVGEKVEFAQRGVLEFLLTSHPLDCPVCDKGGECPLQNLTMQWGPGNSRFDYADKVHFEKPIPLGDLIYLDRERCILCARCVRFQDELADDPVLGFDNRGRSWEIISKSEPAFDSKFSGNTTDICPVGALTSADFRFKARVWELRSVPSICSNCSMGCNISLDMRYDNLMRVMPRENDFVNEIWTCDKGRFGQRFIDSPERLTTPLVRRGDQLVPATWQEAYQLIGEQFAQLHASAGAEALGGLAGPRLSNEDLYLFGRLFREVLGSANLDHRSGAPDEPALDDYSRTLGLGAGSNLMTLGRGTAVLVFGADPEEEAPMYMLRLRGIASRGGDLTVVNSYATKLERSATRALRPRPGGEAQLALAFLLALIDEQLARDEFVVGRVRGLEELRNGLRGRSLAQLAEASGVAEANIRAAVRAFASAENGIIVYGRQTLAGDPAIVRALANLALLTGKVGRANSGLVGLLPGANSRGALDMGIRPEVAGGKRGLSAREIWPAAAERRLRGLYIAGLDPVAENAAAAQAIGALDFVVVQDMFLTETAKRAHVVLPVAAVAEREGTFTNAERRVQRFRQARPAPADLPSDWEVFQQVARTLQAQVPAVAAASAAQRSGQARPGAPAAIATLPISWDYVVASDVADEISRSVAGYAGTSYTSLELTRKSWGRQPNEAIYYDGTSYENSEGVGVQIASLADDPRSPLALGFQEPVSPAQASDFPLTLLAPVRLYDGGGWSRGSKLLPRQVPPHVILSRPDAERLGVAIGETVRVASVAGALELPAQIDAGLAEGLVLIPVVYGVGLSAIQTGAQTGVTVSKVSADGQFEHRHS